MSQESTHDSSPPTANTLTPPPILSSWCCLRPQFSVSGSISLIGPGIGPDDGSRIRTAPLPPGQDYEDPEFKRLKQAKSLKDDLSNISTKTLQEGRDPMLYWLLFGTGAGQLSMCPRNLCTNCSKEEGWKASCRYCQECICFAHDLRGLKTRVCGYRDLSLEDRLMKEDMLNVAQEALKRKHTQIKTMDRITEHLEQHGTLDAQCEHELALITELPTSDDGDLQESDDKISDGFRLPPGCDTDARTSAFAILPFDPAPFNRTSGPLNTTDSWQGCASFVCPELRSIADQRRKCPAVVLKCVECKVNVCPDCWQKKKPCDCSYCKDNFHCPNCFPTFGLKNCKKVEEIERKWREEDAERRKLAERRERWTPNRIAEHVGDFFAGLDAGNSSS
ncbi:MAG: hypothetical protein Q9179_006592 [Wetmoreana sp. 5 TL-2023]